MQLGLKEMIVLNGLGIKGCVFVEEGFWLMRMTFTIGNKFENQTEAQTRCLLLV